MLRDSEIPRMVAIHAQGVNWSASNVISLERAPEYRLSLSEDKKCKEPNEGGTVRLAWDSEYLYVFADLEDKDILATGLEDQLLHYKLGDVLEIFLKPAKKDYYWELFATPLEKKTSLFWQKRGTQGSNAGNVNRLNLEVTCQINGTINNSSDIDKGWQAKVRIPLKDMAALGDTVGPGSAWQILIARQNYTAVVDPNHRELSMAPMLTKTNFHLNEEYAQLIFQE